MKVIESCSCSYTGFTFLSLSLPATPNAQAISAESEAIYHWKPWRLLTAKKPKVSSLPECSEVTYSALNAATTTVCVIIGLRKPRFFKNYFPKDFAQKYWPCLVRAKWPVLTEHHLYVNNFPSLNWLVKWFRVLTQVIVIIKKVGDHMLTWKKNETREEFNNGFN